MKQIKLGFIGYGNMAQAIATGLVTTQTLAPENIVACANHYDKLRENTQTLGIKPLKTSAEVIAASDFIILAVKPKIVESILKPLQKELTGKVLISIVAGYNFERYEALLPAQTHHLSTIPNTPVAVGKGIFVCEQNHSLTVEEYQTFVSIFEKIASIQTVDTALLSLAGTLSGSAPAFTAMYLESLAEAGVKYGLNMDTALEMVAQMMLGTAQLYLETKQHPALIKDRVCSPGGTSIQGVSVLEKSGFRGHVIAAIDAIEGEK